MAAQELQIGAGTFVWALQAICRLHRIPFGANLAHQQFPPPYDLLTLQQAARELGLASGALSAAAAELRALPKPFAALLRSAPGARPQEGTEAAHRLAIVTQCDDKGITWFEEDGPEPRTAALDEFSREFAGEVLLCAPAAPGIEDRDALPNQATAFGFRWFVPELLRHRSIWRDVLAASLGIQLMAIATPVFTQVVIDKVIVHHTLSTLAVIGIALGIFIAFTAALSWIRQYLVLHTGNRIDAVLGAQVFQHLLQLPPRYFEHRPTGVLVARIQGVETIREFLSSAAVTLALDVPFLLIFLAIMFYYSVTLTLITALVLLAMVALSFAVTPLLRQRLNQQFLLGARNQAFLTQYVAGLETVKSLQLEPQLQRRFGEYLATYLRAGFATRQLANCFNVAANALEQLLALAILCMGAWMVMTTREFSIGMLVAFQMFAGRLAQPMLHLVGLWQQLQQARIAVQRLGDLMNAPPEPYSLLPAHAAEAGGGRIEIRNLSFRHASNLPWLYRGLNLVIEPGQCVAILGRSGSGKSTLARLLLGFYQPDEGAILIDQHDSRHLAANELRQHFGVVPQDTVLFSGRIYDNMVLANPHATFEDVVQACRIAGIHETIDALPNGYQTEIGERGAGLSGGQKQRIAIARALLRRPRVLIFDEALASLDAATARELARTVNQFRGRVTMIFIAHQLPDGLQVDRSISLDVAAATVRGTGEGGGP